MSLIDTPASGELSQFLKKKDAFPFVEEGRDLGPQALQYIHTPERLCLRIKQIRDANKTSLDELKWKEICRN